MYDLPVVQNDMDAFVEIWQRFDPKGIGYIEIANLDALLMELQKAQTLFF